MRAFTELTPSTNCAGDRAGLYVAAFDVNKYGAFVTTVQCVTHNRTRASGHATSTQSTALGEFSPLRCCAMNSTLEANAVLFNFKSHFVSALATGPAAKSWFSQGSAGAHLPARSTLVGAYTRRAILPPAPCSPFGRFAVNGALEVVADNELHDRGAFFALEFGHLCNFACRLLEATTSASFAAVAPLGPLLDLTINRTGMHVACLVLVIATAEGATIFRGGENCAAPGLRASSTFPRADSVFRPRGHNTVNGTCVWVADLLFARVGTAPAKQGLPMDRTVTVLRTSTTSRAAFVPISPLADNTTLGAAEVIAV